MFVLIFQSGGEVYRGQTWVSHSRGGQGGPVLLLHPELHRARYQGEKIKKHHHALMSGDL